MVDAGEGWRLLKIGEAIQAGDEVADLDERQLTWRPTVNIPGTPYTEGDSRNLMYRRRVDNTWRLLEVGEVVSPGDEYSYVSGFPSGWFVTASQGITYEETDKKYIIYRRRIDAVDPGQGWRLLVHGEEIAEDDEVTSSCSTGWSSPGRQWTGMIYQRTFKISVRRCVIDIGEGYRRLRAGETIEEGDETRSTAEGASWVKTEQAGYTVRPGGTLIYRRRTEKWLADRCRNWRECSLPEAGALLEAAADAIERLSR